MKKTVKINEILISNYSFLYYPPNSKVWGSLRERAGLDGWHAAGSWRGRMGGTRIGRLSGTRIGPAVLDGSRGWAGGPACGTVWVARGWELAVRIGA